MSDPSSTPDPLDVPEPSHSKLKAFDPELDPGEEEARLARAAEARRERLLADRGNARLQALYEEAGEQLRACRGYWRGIGVATGIRGPVGVANNAVDRGELTQALADLPTSHRKAVLARLGLDDEGAQNG